MMGLSTAYYSLKAKIQHICTMFLSIRSNFCRLHIPQRSFPRRPYLQKPLLLIKWYSSNGTNYKATSIKPIHMQSALDDVPIVGQKYYYKLTWVDYNYNESPFSEVREVQTMKMESDKLVDMIQNAHINYFIENYDINTGM